MQPSLGENGGASASVLERVTFYHWVVVIIASCGWLFDCMDQRIFALSREPAIKELLPAAMAPGDETAAAQKKREQVREAVVKSWGGWATGIMMIGWATGGIIFGMMSDRWGRVKTMVVTLLVYSGFTGLSGIARTPMEFLGYRFLVGLGVGGMFGAATTLVAESVPSHVRAIALGSLQALSAGGNIIGSLLSTVIQPGQAEFLFGQSGWRVLFFVGILPAILVVPIIFVLREPERWKEAKRKARESERRVPAHGFDPRLVPASQVAAKRAGRRVLGAGGDGRPVGHRVLFAGTDHQRAEGPRRASKRH